MFNTMAYKRLLKYKISVRLFIVSCENSKCLKQFKKGHGDNLELSENSEFPVRWILGSELSFFARYILFNDTWNHAWKTGWKCVLAYEAYEVLRMCLKY